MLRYQIFWIFGLLGYVRCTTPGLGSCYYPGGDWTPQNFPCDPYAYITVCCPLGWTCYSNLICVITDPDTANATFPVGTSMRGTCTDPLWDDSSCGNFCLDEPVHNNSGLLKPCGDDSFCCEADHALGLCNCASGQGVFSLSQGSLQTVLGVTGVVYTETPYVTPTPLISSAAAPVSTSVTIVASIVQSTSVIIKTSLSVQKGTTLVISLVTRTSMQFATSVEVLTSVAAMTSTAVVTSTEHVDSTAVVTSIDAVKSTAIVTSGVVVTSVEVITSVDITPSITSSSKNSSSHPFSIVISATLSTTKRTTSSFFIYTSSAEHSQIPSGSHETTKRPRWTSSDPQTLITTIVGTPSILSPAKSLSSSSSSSITPIPPSGAGPLNPPTTGSAAVKIGVGTTVPVAGLALAVLVVFYWRRQRRWKGGHDKPGYSAVPYSNPPPYIAESGPQNQESRIEDDISSAERLSVLGYPDGRMSPSTNLSQHSGSLGRQPYDEVTSPTDILQSMNSIRRHNPYAEATSLFEMVRQTSSLGRPNPYDEVSSTTDMTRQTSSFRRPNPYDAAAYASMSRTSLPAVESTSHPDIYVENPLPSYLPTRQPTLPRVSEARPAAAASTSEYVPSDHLSGLPSPPPPLRYEPAQLQTTDGSTPKFEIRRKPARANSSRRSRRSTPSLRSNTIRKEEDVLLRPSSVQERSPPRRNPYDED